MAEFGEFDGSVMVVDCIGIATVAFFNPPDTPKTVIWHYAFVIIF